ncbi:hypothetical protein CLPU_12c00530 [Gottschalkia purinilytica]|uniref:DUF5362 domain-containing protein n=1 Tax=Gottschalkia purinilytica TaxID=1503 RepID=A0A0L0W8Z6_GOTPU|nr:DUF5362 family protein [Gottschalkia purinilytica]KNF07780.1 hypothetical protein CLPU_12c00530 [Gottschalkia purinilytica]
MNNVNGTDSSNNISGVNNTQINKEALSSLSSWSSFISIVTIISGILTCLGSIFTFGLSLIPGIITIILGVKLNNAKNSIRNYLNGNEAEINMIFENMKGYFKLQGILIIVGFVLVILGIIISVAFVGTFIEAFGTL